MDIDRRLTLELQAEMEPDLRRTYRLSLVTVYRDRVAALKAVNLLPELDQHHEFVRDHFAKAPEPEIQALVRGTSLLASAAIHRSEQHVQAQ
jgi:hypothetical protein